MLSILFAIFSIAIALLIAYTSRSVRVVVGITAWMALAALLTMTDLLHRFDSLPPPAPLLFVCGFVATVLLARSRFASGWLQLTPSFLIGFQSFRIVVELFIHSAVSQGIAPPQMTWSGLNFDIVTGVTAVVVALLAHRLPRTVLLAWNTFGLALLVWVVSVATVSMPTRFQVLTPSNTWVADFPFVWLPTIHVTAALLFHIILYRRLSR